MKKKVMVLLLLTAAISMCLSVAACGKKVELVDFQQAYSETAALGDVYELKVKSVKDTDGNEYSVSATVVDKEGNSVQVLDNKFDIESMKYVITYTAKISDTDVRTSVLTLNITDSLAPIIRINKPLSGIKDVEYTLPSITAEDSSGGNVEVTVKVFYIKSESEKIEQTLTDKKFTPTLTGKYEIFVTAKDSSNNEAKKSEFFTVVQPAKAGEIANLDYVETLGQFTNDKNLKMEHVAADATRAGYTGGYVTFSDGTGWSNICVKPRLPKADYAGFDFISVWVYMADATPDVNSDAAISVFNDTAYTKQIKTNKWFQLLYPMERFLKAYDNMDAGTEKFIPVNLKAATSEMMRNIQEIRIGSIMSHKDAKFTFEMTHAPIVSEGTPVDVTITVGSEHGTNIGHNLIVTDELDNIYESVSVENGVHMFELRSGRYFYKIVSADEHNVYVGEKVGEFYVEYKNSITIPTVTETYAVGDTMTIPNAAVTTPNEGAVAEKSVKYVEAAIGTEIEVTGGTYVPKVSGKLVINYTYENALGKELTIEVARGAFDNRYVLNPNEKSDMILDTAKNDNSIKSFVEVDGGINYFSYMRKAGFSGWANLGLSPRTNFNTLKTNYTHVRLKIYYAGTEEAFCTGAFLCDTYLYNGETGSAVKGEKLATNTWHTIDFPVQDFINNYNKKPNGSAGSFLGVKFGDTAANAAYPNITEIRIAAIYGVADPKLSVAVNAPDLQVGEDSVDVTLTVASELATIPTYVLTLLDASNQAVEPKSSANNVYTYSLIGGDYTYNIKCTHDNYYFDKSASFSVVSYLKIEVGDYADSVVAGTAVEFLDGIIYQSGEATENRAAISAKFIYAADNKEVQIESAESFTPDASGLLVITYSYEGAASETVNLQVTRNLSDFREGYIIDTQSKDIVSDFAVTKAAAKISYVSAEENTDETYSGAYIKVTGNGAGWTNLNFNGRQTIAKEKLSEYDYITLWIYLEYVTPGGTHDLSIYNLAGTDSEGLKQNQGVITGTWNKLYLPIKQFASLYDNLYAAPAKQAFLPFNFDAGAKWLLNVRIGEMQLHKNTDTLTAIVEDSKVKINLTNKDDVDFEVKIVDETGATVNEFATDKATTAYEFAHTASCKKVIVTYKYALSLTAKDPVQTYIKVTKEIIL